MRWASSPARPDPNSAIHRVPVALTSGSSSPSGAAQILTALVGRLRPRLAPSCPKSANFGRNRPRMVRSGPNLAEHGRVRPKACRIRSRFGRYRTTSWPSSAKNLTECFSSLCARETENRNEERGGPPPRGRKERPHNPAPMPARDRCHGTALWAETSGVASSCLVGARSGVRRANRYGRRHGPSAAWRTCAWAAHAQSVPGTCPGRGRVERSRSCRLPCRLRGAHRVPRFGAPSSVVS